MISYCSTFSRSLSALLGPKSTLDFRIVLCNSRLNEFHSENQPFLNLENLSQNTLSAVSVKLGSKQRDGCTNTYRILTKVLLKRPRGMATLAL